MENDYNNPNNQPSSAPIMTVGDWFITLLLTAIPIVNIILLLVWSFSSETNINKKNWAKVQLIFLIIAVVFGALFGGCVANTIVKYGA